MKLFFVILCATVCYADKLENTYLPPGNARTAGGSGSFLQTPKGFSSSSGSSLNSQPVIPILKANSDIREDGSFNYEYETANGISAQEVGQQKSLGQETANSVQGIFTYTGDDGQQYSVSYIADENGFQPQGSHLPTPPPIPAEILKALEQNAADEARGIVDDGSYKEESAAGVSKQYLAPKPSGFQKSGYRY